MAQPGRSQMPTGLEHVPSGRTVRPVTIQIPNPIDTSTIFDTFPLETSNNNPKPPAPAVPLPPPPVYSLADFEVIKPITKGAFGRVLLVKPEQRKGATTALDPNKLYAMKVLHRSGITESKVQKRLILEYEILEKLSTEHNDYIVKLVCSFQTQRNFYLVMEFQPGGDLFSFLTAMGYFDESVAIQYLTEIILAVEFLHSNNIVHCDLKPDNLLIGSDGHLRLTDFGLSFTAMFSRVDNDHMGTLNTSRSSPPASPQDSINQNLNSPPPKRKLSLRNKLHISDITIPTASDLQRSNKGSHSQAPVTAPPISPSTRFAQMTFDFSDQSKSETSSPVTANSASSPFSVSSSPSGSQGGDDQPGSRRSRRLSRKSIGPIQPKSCLGQSVETADGTEGADEQNDEIYSGSEKDYDDLSNNEEENDSNTEKVRIKGTPDYIAPEIIEASPFSTSFSVDWWAVGIIFYEMLTGTTPFNAPTRDEVFDSILDKDLASIMKESLPEEVGEDSRSLLFGLLEKNPTKRLGTYEGAAEIKNHRLFADVDWDTVFQQEPVFAPSFEEETTTEYFDARDERFPVVSITTDDVTEDIKNARKERALQHFNERSERLKQETTRQRQLRNAHRWAFISKNPLGRTTISFQQLRHNAGRSIKLQSEQPNIPTTTQTGVVPQIPPFRPKDTHKNRRRSRHQRDLFGTRQIKLSEVNEAQMISPMDAKRMAESQTGDDPLASPLNRSYSQASPRNHTTFPRISNLFTTPTTATSPINTLRKGTIYGSTLTFNQSRTPHRRVQTMLLTPEQTSSVHRSIFLTKQKELGGPPDSLHTQESGSSSGIWADPYNVSMDMRDHPVYAFAAKQIDNDPPESPHTELNSLMFSMPNIVSIKSRSRSDVSGTTLDPEKTQQTPVRFVTDISKSPILESPLRHTPIPSKSRDPSDLITMSIATERVVPTMPVELDGTNEAPRKLIWDSPDYLGHTHLGPYTVSHNPTRQISSTTNQRSNVTPENSPSAGDIHRDAPHVEFRSSLDTPPDTVQQNRGESESDSLSHSSSPSPSPVHPRFISPPNVIPPTNAKDDHSPHSNQLKAPLGTPPLNHHHSDTHSSFSLRKLPPNLSLETSPMSEQGYLDSLNTDSPSFAASGHHHLTDSLRSLQPRESFSRMNSLSLAVGVGEDTITKLVTNASSTNIDPHTHGFHRRTASAYPITPTRAEPGEHSFFPDCDDSQNESFEDSFFNDFDSERRNSTSLFSTPQQ
ncbi:putative serine/threonine protein kinase [Blattamonas nauphoetae]|uniref:non-specific serine/threonine protein kinase n=1 Tax=Blattamonas nauphoetae TaxID=2049346 RepID=A0ABQ9Y4U9_9EUKA|nr:putative serine/threonine protein kinase [Blattamonas nauphoetae]